jgi:hypothetical protein
MPRPELRPEELAQLAQWLVEVPLREADRAATARLLDGLTADMQALRRMNVGPAEPAVTYRPGAP